MVTARAFSATLVVGMLSSVLSGQQWTDPSPHTRSFVGIGDGLALEVLDWGGSGPPLILLAGLGNTAHVFDTFAVRFNDRFHVLGITRRGYGASGHPESGYDIATLARDLDVVCDRLNLDRVVLVGHSLAGDELTKFAATYPTRVSALVYLDSAHDRTTLPATGNLPQQRPQPADLRSLDDFRNYFARMIGARTPEAETRATLIVDGGGRVLRGGAQTGAQQAVLAGLEHPAYKEVRAPALAIYPPVEIRNLFPNYDSFDAENKERADRAVPELKRYQDTNAALFLRDVEHARIVRLQSGSHYIFLTNEAEVVGLIRDFLAQVLPS